MKSATKNPGLSCHRLPLLLLSLCFLAISHATAKTVEYHLTIAEKRVNFTGHPETAIAVNDSIPRPHSRFMKAIWRASM